jgi:hypothetical protein
VAVTKEPILPEVYNNWGDGLQIPLVTAASNRKRIRADSITDMQDLEDTETDKEIESGIIYTAQRPSASSSKAVRQRIPTTRKIQRICESTQATTSLFL